MIVDPTTSIILSTQRYKSAPRVDQFINVPFAQSTKTLTEYDRSVDISLATVFDEERQLSTIFRPVTKFAILFENAYTGSTKYVPFRDNLYYTNAIINAQDYYYQGNTMAVQPPGTDQNIPWDGFPQYSEFDFIRTDNDVIGYTQPPNNHVTFKNVSATTYNWSHYISYPYKNNFNKTLSAIEPGTNIQWSWVASSGLPYYVLVGNDKNTRQITFKCPMTHGLSVGEYVQLSVNYNGNQLFQVSSLGTTGSGSEEYIFSISNIGYTGNVFQTNSKGTFKRVINAGNSGDTISEYYVRQHKIITKPECAVLVNAGFERNIYGNKQKCEIKVLTPNQKVRNSIKEGDRSYTLSFNCDVDINGLKDNQGRPLTELFFTTIWRGYFGWTSVMREGWYFNTYLQKGKPQTWWDTTNANANVNISENFYTTPSGGNVKFYYNDLLNTGNTLNGDFCEWNNFDQFERVISTYQHKIKYNENWFTIKNKLPTTNQYGYFYQPHNPVQIASFSDYIEEGSSANVVGIPDYAYYSTTTALFRWRDLYPYGFIDPNGVGVDYPFLNGAQYPFTNTIFRITPENYNIPSDYANIGSVPVNITTITDPLVDECE
jgi:hypothetical protein